MLVVMDSIIHPVFILSPAWWRNRKWKNISVELFGAQNTIGINYDSRLKGNSGLGYRIGIGFGYADNSNLFDENIKGVGMPLEMNYLLGNKHNKLEIGIGTSLGFYHV